MVKTKIVGIGKLDKAGLKKIGKSLLLTLGAAFIGWIGDSVGLFNYGSSETLVATLLPFGINFLKKLLLKYTSE